MPIPGELIDGETLSDRQEINIRQNIGSETDIAGKKISALAGFDITTWYTSRGLTQFVNIPLIAGDTAVGALAIYLPDNETLPQENIELALTLARQLTLAVQLTNLAEEARQLAIFQERSYIASDVHDNLAQDFAGILMQIQAHEYVLPSNPKKALSHLLRAQNLATKGLTEARRSVWMLKQESEDYQELVPLVHQLVRRLSEDLPVTTEIEVLGTAYPINPEIGRHLLQIVQEATINSLRHANPQNITIRLNYTPERLSLRIQDDGRGFEPQTTTSKGFGLKIMEQRSQLIDARFTLESERENGTVIDVVVEF